MSEYPQEVKDKVGSKVLELCLKELFIYNFMQTDPNPANFYYDQRKKRLNLIDFGAARNYDKEFVDTYMKIIHSAVINDHEGIIKYSKDLGFLSGLENEVMLEAHANSVEAIAQPFNVNSEDLFDFGNQGITNKIYKNVPIMLKNRLKAPPMEIYSLHRRLSGAYLICIKLKSKVEAKKMFRNIYDNYISKVL